MKTEDNKYTNDDVQDQTPTGAEYQWKKKNRRATYGPITVYRCYLTMLVACSHAEQELFNNLGLWAPFSHPRDELEP